jgi:hypothetical protein
MPRVSNHEATGVRPSVKLTGKRFSGAEASWVGSGLGSHKAAAEHALLRQNRRARIASSSRKLRFSSLPCRGNAFIDVVRKFKR